MLVYQRVSKFYLRLDYLEALFVFISPSGFVEIIYRCLFVSSSGWQSDRGIFVRCYTTLYMGVSENWLNPIVPNGFADYYPY